MPPKKRTLTLVQDQYPHRRCEAPNHAHASHLYMMLAEDNKRYTLWCPGGKA